MKSTYISLTLILTIIFATTLKAQDDEHYFDSLIHLANTLPDDTNRLYILNKLGYEHYSVDTVEKYATIQYELAKQLHTQRCGYYEAKALGYLYWCNFHTNNLVKANEYAFQAIVVADSVGERRIIAANYHNIGIAYSAMQDGTKANEYFHKALDIYIQIGDSISACDVLRNIAYNDYLYEMYAEAEKYYRQALSIDRNAGNKHGESEDLLGLGALAHYRYENDINHPDSLIFIAKQHYLDAYHLAKESSHDYTLFIVYSELPFVLFSEIDQLQLKGSRASHILDSCYTLIHDGYLMADRLGYDSDKLELDFAWSSYLINRKRFNDAQIFLDSISTVFDSDKELYSRYLAKLNHAYVGLYETTGDFKKALEYQRKADYYYKQNRKQDYAITATQSMIQSEFEDKMNKQRELEYKLKADVERQSLITTIVIIVLALLLPLVILVIRNYLKSRQLNLELDVKNSELEQQKQEILEQNECLEEQKDKIEMQKRDLESQNKIISLNNQAMTDSIRYASLIQRAAMPSESLMNNIFGDHLVIFRPLNIVSGDFYWATSVGKYKMLAVADCTGHGVPGAFLSMLGISILDYLSASIIQRSDTTAGEVLDNVRKLFEQSLHQHGGGDDNHDGIDIALVIFDTQLRKMHYAGAYRPLVIIHDGQINKIDADRMPIGVHYKESDHFTNHTLDMQHGDVIYLFSDGMTDQFGFDGNHEVHKFTTKRLRQLLLDIHRLPFSAQKTAVENTIDKWRADSYASTGELYEQTDDSILVGIRIS